MTDLGSTHQSTRTRTIQAGFESEPPIDNAQLPTCGEKVGGRCVLRQLLGEGAFGRVFAAEDEETGQQVALKVVGLRRYPREYAEHELRALAAIAHPHVVQLNEHGVEASAPEPYLWYTMPLYRGSDLAASLDARGSLSLGRAHAVFTRIAGGVCEMHALGLRHQDIKPDNIYLASMAGLIEQHPVLLDLGGAAREHANRPLVATFPFAAPEQCEALIGGMLGEVHAPLTEKVDVYALAATLLFSLIGAQMVGHDIAQRESSADATPEAVRAQLAEIHAVRATQPIPAGALPLVTGNVRVELNRAFARWLSIDPTRRPSARLFVEELSVLLEWDEEFAREQGAREWRSTLLGIAGGLSLAACVGGLVGYQWHKRSVGEAREAASAARRQADAASRQLSRADSTLTEVSAESALLSRANEQLQSEQRRALEQAQQDHAALIKAQVERDAARADLAAAQTAVWKAEAARDQARSDLAAAELARARAEHERVKQQQEKAATEPAPGN